MRVESVDSDVEGVVWKVVLGYVSNGVGFFADLFLGPTPPFRPGCNGIPTLVAFVRFTFFAPDFVYHCKKSNSLFAECAVAKT